MVISQPDNEAEKRKPTGHQGRNPARNKKLPPTKSRKEQKPEWVSPPPMTSANIATTASYQQPVL